MKTNTNYNLSAIMTRAWSIRKAAAAECGCKVSEVVWSLCLKQAWSEASVPAATRQTVNRWASMSGDDQMTMIKRCVYKCARGRDYVVTERGHEINEYINEAWLRLYKSLDYDNLLATNTGRVADGKKPITLVSLVYNAASLAIDAIMYADSKHAAATSYILSDNEGNMIDYIDTVAADDDTEAVAALKVELQKYYDKLSDSNKTVFGLLILGYSEREIAGYVGVSGPAIHKRIVKIRKDLEYLRK